MKYKKEFIKEFKKLLDKYNYCIYDSWDEGCVIYSKNKEDEFIIDSLSLSSIDDYINSENIEKG